MQCSISLPNVIAQLTLPGGRLLKLDKEWEEWDKDKEWEENKLQLFLYSDGVGGQVRPQQKSSFCNNDFLQFLRDHHVLVKLKICSQNIQI